jgi:hypothetical protein
MPDSGGSSKSTMAGLVKATRMSAARDECLVAGRARTVIAGQFRAPHR